MKKLKKVLNVYIVASWLLAYGIMGSIETGRAGEGMYKCVFFFTITSLLAFVVRMRDEKNIE